MNVSLRSILRRGARSLRGREPGDAPVTAVPSGHRVPAGVGARPEARDVISYACRPADGIHEPSGPDVVIQGGGDAGGHE